MASNRLRELQNRALRPEMEIIEITAAYAKMVYERKQNVYGPKIGIDGQVLPVLTNAPFI